MGVQEFRWEEGGNLRAGDYNFFYGKGFENHQSGTELFVHHRTISAVKREDFVSDWVLYIVLRGCWCNIIVVTVRALSEVKRDGLCEELEQVFGPILPSKKQSHYWPEVAHRFPGS